MNARARAHHPHPHDRPGLHAARLQPRHRRRDQRLPRDQHLHSRRSPTPSPSNPTEIEVAHEERAAGDSKYSLYSLVRLNFDLVTGFSVVPLQLFSLFGIADLDRLGAVLLAVMRARCSPAEPRARCSRFWDRDILPFFLIGIILFGIGLLGEYVGPHLPAGARAAALRHPGACSRRNSHVTPSAVVFALPRRRRALPRRPARRRRRGAAGRHAPGRSRREASGSPAWRTSPATEASQTLARSDAAELERQVAPRPGFPLLVLLPPHAAAGAARSARGAARSTCTARSCRSTAAARRSTGRSSTARPRPARRCTRWWRSPTPGASSTSRRCPSSRTTPRSTCSASVTDAAETVLRAQPAAPRRRQRGAAAAGPLARQLLRRAQAGGRPHRLVEERAGDPQPGARRRAALSRRVHRGRRTRAGSCARGSSRRRRAQPGAPRAPISENGEWFAGLRRW